MAPLSPTDVLATTESVPTKIREYRVLRPLAAGGTSDILLACAEGPGGFERVVVLKVLLSQLCQDERFRRMFTQEAAAYARLSHPAIVRMYDFFSDAGRLVLVLEYVDGLPLSKIQNFLRAAGRRLDDTASLFVAWRVFSALAAAHAAKDLVSGEFGPIIHRDLNPSNVLVPWDGHVKLADFGMAKVAGLSYAATTNLLGGSFGYIAPEQARGEEVTVRADVYVGCVLIWELLTGRKAIVRSARLDGDLALAMSAPSFPALATLRPDLPKVLLDAVAGGLATNPDARNLTAEDFSDFFRTAVDLDEGRQSLLETLAAMRATAGEPLLESTPRTQAVITPVAPPIADPRPISDWPVALSGPAPASRPSAVVWIAALVVIGISVALGLSSRPRSGSRVPSAAAAPSPAPSLSTQPSALPSASATPVREANDSSSATVTVGASHAGHRVWIDDRLVGEAPGQYRVACGAHSVRVGSQGELHHFDVACNAEVVFR